ncbi:NADPH2:quinone reductase [Bradyrhizobium sp. USDA 4524]|uniref:NADPH:quinone oxidoreductase family protein n=1 Tax=unclassified Bradyrhizobium TaxID=2631580 RepID=UPI00209E0EDE|nr:MULTISPECIES: NADPH:quinone oxidoreductase family protein [unclassified Bradyrhizobium]MCP1845128.1 NADPH2:quinone reductase [Bradyrhizobium sp. USDA 4538]MCP1905693.1 NADPH2:quinone reductase [Bradyrhizobium sp. USDA 4537]MCP1988651.1 NADPH2:quinone reductase [Bradyrhizobium sp. USDA 4539]
MMRAVIGHRFGGIDDLVYDDTTSPAIEPGTIRVSVRAAGVSFANLLFIAGKHQNRPSIPFVPGTEIGGVVSEIASDVRTDLKVGDRVCAGLPSGGFAEEAIVDVANVFRIPDSLSFEGSTLFPTIYATAYAGLKWRANLQSSETLLVHGAAGASGLAAVEVGRALGATVIATAGGERKIEAVKRYGAHHAIDYRRGGFRDRVLEITGGRGADVVFDPVGGDVFDESLRCVAPLGRLIPMGFAAGRIPEIPANTVLVKNLTVIGLYWGFYMAWGKTKADAALREKVRILYGEMFDLFEAGKLRAPVDGSLPLADFATAMRRVESRKVVGKIVLIPEQRA